MKVNLIVFSFLLSCSSVTFGQAQAPDLGTAYSFALFTAAGAFTNTGLTQVTGDIGSNTAQPTGDTIILNGARHFVNTIAAQAAIDVLDAYTMLGSNGCTNTLPAELEGVTLTAGVYCTGGAATLTGTLILDAENNPNALFIIKVDGAFTTEMNSQVDLVNGASLRNVYFYVTGEVNLGAGSLFQGTILSGGAINLLDGATLSGRALTTAGAITLLNNEVASPVEMPLPVVLTSFSAVAKSQGVSLSWSTASEQDNLRFDVERSETGKTFTKIGEVKGAGTTSEQARYTFLDRTALSGTGYYRLRQVNTNGTHEYSRVISGSQKETGDHYPANAYPNPSTGLFTLPANTAAGQHYRVYNLLGLALEHGTLHNGNLNLSHLAQGTYLLELTGASGRSIQRVVRQ